MSKIAKISVAATTVLLIILVSCNKDDASQECIFFRTNAAGQLLTD